MILLINMKTLIRMIVMILTRITIVLMLLTRENDNLDIG